MQFSKYEETFTNVNDVQGSAAKYADQVADIIRNAKDGITCKEIGIKLFGEHEYNKWGRSHASELGHVLSNLTDGHFIKFEKVETGEVLTWEEQIWTWDKVKDTNNEPRTIHVHDDAGREYVIDNPRYDYTKRVRPSGHYETITKSVKVKFKVGHWIGE